MPFIGKQSTSNSQITNYTTTVGSGGQTNFTVVVEGGDETHVYLNGVLLKETTDYTVSSTQVSLVSPAVENDIVEIKVFRSFALVDAVRASEGGTFSGNVAVNGDLTVDTDTLKVDSSANQVGIGTNSQKAKLDVRGQVVLGNVGNSTITNLTSGTPPQLVAGFSAPAITWSPSSWVETVVSREQDCGMDILAGNAHSSLINFSDTDLENPGTIEYDHASDYMRFNVNATERLRIDSSGNVDVKTGNLVIGTAGKGIDFSATGNPTRGVHGASVLDDYESGSSGSSSGTNDPQFFAGSSTISYSSSFLDYTASYIKIGDMVTVFFSLDNYNASGNVNLGTGNIGFYLPYTVATASAKTINTYYSGFLYYYDGTNYGKGFALCSSGGSVAYLRKNNVIDDFDANGATRTYFNGSITYRSA